MTSIDFGTGKCSWFGGADDDGVGLTEGLALIQPTDLSDWQFSRFFPDDKIEDLMLPNTSMGLARNLNPNALYCAMDWEYPKYADNEEAAKEILRYSLVKVDNEATGKFCICSPVDWGPSKDTGRLIDLSPGALKKLGEITDNIVRVTLILP